MKHFKILKAVSFTLVTAILVCLCSCGGTNTATTTTVKQDETDQAAINFSVDTSEESPALGDNDFSKKSDYKLVWSDEFDGDKLNENDWGYEVGFIRNNEPQYYTNSQKNVLVKDGALNLICLREDFTADDGKTSKYTSGSVNTSGKQSFKYGAIEMRAKLPTTYNPSAWPAFWMMGQNGNWPESSETDIMEMYGTDMTKYEWTVHWADETKDDNYNNSWKAAGDNGNIEKYDNNGIALGMQWHTYGVDWDEKQYRFYFDNKTVATYDITDKTMSEIHQNNFILLDLALTSSSIDGVNDDMFPLIYSIDYVRVYQKQG